MPVVKGLSAIQGCPFGGVPLYNKLHTILMITSNICVENLMVDVIQLLSGTASMTVNTTVNMIAHHPVKPRAVMIKPGAVMVKPRAVMVKSRAVMVKPKAVIVKPRAVMVKSRALATRRASVASLLRHRSPFLPAQLRAG